MDPDEITPPQFKQQAKEEQRKAAVNLVRAKLDTIYSHEPDAADEQAEVEALADSHLSKHQKFMKKLTESGKDTVEIQTAWHEYYQNLAEDEKHEVWQEFYSEQAIAKKQREAEAAAAKAEPKPVHHGHTNAHSEPAHHPTNHAEHPNHPKHHNQPRHHPARILAKKRSHNSSTELSAASAIAIKRLRRKHHIKSLVFGLGMGSLVVFILLFSFFNERFIIPFIRPSSNVSATPIIVDPNSTGPVGPESKIIIPKINVEVPVIYDVATIEEADVQAGLERGVVHYATTANPGEQGNAVIFGHSSSNILNKGKYKFAFILLKSLEDEDTFIIQKDGKRYVYKVYKKYVTSPTDFSVLDPTDRSIVTLITCDPPGTSTNRLIIQAEQIFPDPATNPVSSATQSKAAPQPQQLPSNSVSLWSRITNWF